MAAQRPTPDDDLPPPIPIDPRELEEEQLEPVELTPEEAGVLLPEPLPVEEEEPIELVEGTSGGTSKISAMGSVAKMSQRGSAYKRSLNANGTGATRCRIFHSRIAIAPLEYMENQINEWLDGDNIEIKHVGHVVGTMEGKTPEPNLVVMVWF